MYCKNCGSEVNPQAAVCLKCGVANGRGSNYCSNCGSATVPGASVCTSCGFALTGVNGVQKSRIAAGLLGIFLGCFGVHNFYLGYTGKAIAQLLLTVLTCGIGAVISSIWGLIEGILILAGSINEDANGYILKD